MSSIGPRVYVIGAVRSSMTAGHAVEFIMAVPILSKVIAMNATELSVLSRLSRESRYIRWRRPNMSQDTGASSRCFAPVEKCMVLLLG